MADGGIRVKVSLDTASLASSAKEAGRVAALAAGEAILSRAVSLAPRRTGALAASGSVQMEGDTAVVRFAEMDGHSGPVRVRLFERELEAECGPFQVRTFRETGEEVNLIEWKEEEKEDGKG